MTDVPRYPVHDIGFAGAVPDNTFAVKVSNLGAYGENPEAAIRAYADAHSATVVQLHSLGGEQYAFLQFPG